MANPDIPNGFVPTPLSKVRPYEVLVGYGTAIYPGDVTDALTDGSVGVAAAAATTINGSSMDYSAASTANTIGVADDPQQEFVAQDDASATPVQADVFENADHVATTGDTTLLQSRHEIAISTAVNTTGGFMLTQLIKNPDLSIGVNAVWRCLCNEHVFHTGKTTTSS